MNVLYRVTCECGRSVLVGEAQAGSTVPCECGASVTTPKLRELRSLPREEAPAAPSGARARAQRDGGTAWDARQAILFGLGVATVLAGVTFAILYVGRARLYTEWTPEIQKLVDDDLIDSVEPAQTVGMFYELYGTGLGVQRPDTNMLNHGTYQRLGPYVSIAGGVAAALAVAWGVALVVMRKKAS